MPLRVPSRTTANLKDKSSSGSTRWICLQLYSSVFEDCEDGSRAGSSTQLRPRCLWPWASPRPQDRPGPFQICHLGLSHRLLLLSRARGEGERLCQRGPRPGWSSSADTFHSAEVALQGWCIFIYVGLYISYVGFESIGGGLHCPHPVTGTNALLWGE